MFLGVEGKSILESELILAKVFWSATNRGKILQTVDFDTLCLSR